MLRSVISVYSEQFPETRSSLKIAVCTISGALCVRSVQSSTNFSGGSSTSGILNVACLVRCFDGTFASPELSTNGPQDVLKDEREIICFPGFRGSDLRTRNIKLLYLKGRGNELMDISEQGFTSWIKTLQSPRSVFSFRAKLA